MINLEKQYTQGMFFTDEVKKQLTKKYWEEFVDLHLFESDSYPEMYNRYLPYLKDHVLEKALLYCENREDRFDINKSESKNPIHFFSTLMKNITIGERMGFVNNIKYVSDPIDYVNRYGRPPHETSIKYFNSMCKKFNREQRLTELGI